MAKPFVNKKFLLEKFYGKGGWTYLVIPGIPKEKRKAMGWLRVKGLIDDYEIKGYNLMPMANGNLMLPVKPPSVKKSASRKAIG